MNNENKKSDVSSKKVLKTLLEYLEMCAIAILAALVIFTFFFRVCYVDGGSMKNTFEDKQVVLASNLFYSPKQGDVVVFHPSNGNEKPYIKRVIALEGQKVTIDLTSGIVCVDGNVLEEDYVYLKDNIYDSNAVYNFSYFNIEHLSIDKSGHTVYSVTVPEDCIFVMGDNRNGSTDSRSAGVGFVNENSIIGKVFLRISPFTLY